MNKKYLITDIHGCLKTLDALLRVLDPDDSDALYFLGDYVDRGPDSAGVLQRLMEIKQDRPDTVIIRGNHEQLFLDSRADEEIFQRWFYTSGGEPTMLSFQASKPSEIPDEIFDFINEMSYYHETEEAFLVHAGFNFDDPRRVFEDTHAMMNIRSMNIDQDIVRYKKIIHGHTPITLIKIRTSIDQDLQEINLDNGCVFGPMEEYGNLTALELTDMELFLQPYSE